MPSRILLGRPGQSAILGHLPPSHHHAIAANRLSRPDVGQTAVKLTSGG
jgi:hypothetical protein